MAPMRFVFLLLFSCFVFGEELEVHLKLRAELSPIYLGAFYSSESDSSKWDEMRSLLETDLNRGGYAIVLPKDDSLESAIRSRFSASIWKKEKIPFCLSAQVVQNRLEVSAFNVEKGTSKKYPAIPMERQAIHKLADAIQKDLFGKEGIASCKLIYTVRTKNPKQGLGWLSEVWMSDSDGEGAIQLTKENSYCLSPFFFPGSSSEFFYTSEKSGQSKIYRASLSEPVGKLMVDLRGNQALASMKGGYMAFITDVAGRPDLFVQSVDSMGKMSGKARQLFSDPRATQASPTFSPDGKRVAFVSDKDGTPRVYVLDVALSKTKGRPQPQLLTKKNRENTSPSWSPDGTKLAYSAKVDGVRQIWIFDFLTNEETQITTGPENKENPSWAPDSFHLVFNTEDDEHCDLYLIHLNQGDPIRIGKGRFASWQQRYSQ